MFRTRGHDDRGDNVLMHHVWLGTAAAGSPLTLVRRLSSAIAFAIFRGPAGRAIVLVAGFAVALKLVLAFGPFALVIGMFSPVSTTVILVVLSVSLSGAAAWKRQGEHARFLMLRDGVCPGCAYPLDQLEPEPDGHVVCPECGGAWDRDLAPGEVRRVVVNAAAFENPPPITPTT